MAQFDRFLPVSSLFRWLKFGRIDRREKAKSGVAAGFIQK
jgi:hypothetical protein